MRKLIICPTRYIKYTNIRYDCIFNRMKELGYQKYYTDEPDTNGADVILAGFYPQHWTNRAMELLLKAHKQGCKLIAFLGDPHASRLCNIRFVEDRYKRKLHINIFERFNMILSMAREKPTEWFPDYIERFVFLKDWYSPREYYDSLIYNETPINKCLLSGTIHPEAYPLRYYIDKKGDPNRIIRVDGVGSFGLCDKKLKRIGKGYADMLHSYFCCVTDSLSTDYNYSVTKYVEIPATGSLLIASDCADVRWTGLIPDEHFVSINKSNALDKIYDCLKRPDCFNKMRMNAMNFVRKNCNREVAFDTICEGLKKYKIE